MRGVAVLATAVLLCAALAPVLSYVPCALFYRPFPGIHFSGGQGGPKLRGTRGVDLGQKETSGMSSPRLTKKNSISGPLAGRPGRLRWQTVMTAESEGGVWGDGREELQLPDKLDELASWIGESKDEKEVGFARFP